MQTFLDLTKQQAFDQALAHLRKQGRLAYDAVTSTCYYRHPDDPNLKCAVGALIPDNHDLDLSSIICSAGTLIKEYLRLDLPVSMLTFYNNLQSELHDNISTGHPFDIQLERRAKAFAEDYDLEYAAP